MNRKRSKWCVLPVLVFFASLWAYPPSALAEIGQDLNHAIHAQSFTSWQSPAKLHKAIGREKGDLIISGEGIEFRSAKGGAVKWPFAEVQTFLLLPHVLAIETYQNRRKHLPGLQRYRFDLEQAVPLEVATGLAEEVQRPSQNAVPDPASQKLSIAVHHRTLTGGTNGTLRFRDGGIDYVTSVVGDSRSWRWADLQTLSDPDPYHLLVFGYRDTYTFDLKQPLEQSLFYRLVNAVDAHNLTEPGQVPHAQSPKSADTFGPGAGDE